MSTSANEDPLIALFKSIGLTQAKASEALKAPKSAAILKEIIESKSDKVIGLDEKTATLVANLSIVLSKAGAIGSDERNYVVEAITNSKLKTVDQVSGAVNN